MEWMRSRGPIGIFRGRDSCFWGWLRLVVEADDVKDTRSLDNTKSKVWRVQQQVFPQFETKVIKPVGEKNHFWRLSTRQKKCYAGSSDCWLEPTHNITNILCPNLTVRVSILPACWKQRIRRIVWKLMFDCRKLKETVFAVGCIINVKRMDRFHSSLVVSLHNR